MYANCAIWLLQNAGIDACADIMGEQKFKFAASWNNLYANCAIWLLQNAGIDACAGIMGESQETLDHRRKIVGEKQRALHQEWHTQVRMAHVRCHDMYM